MSLTSNPFSRAIKNIDKAVKNGVTSKNTCARNKSRLTKKVNEME